MLADYDLGTFLLLFFGGVLVASISILILTSALAGQSIRQTFYEIWQTYFGKGDQGQDE